MKSKVLLASILISMLVVNVWAQDSSVMVNPFPFAEFENPGPPLVQAVPDPPGYKRFGESDLTEYQLWLTNLPLKAQGSRILDWKGNPISEPDTINGILDFKVDSKYITAADIPVMLLMHFFRLKGIINVVPIRISETMTVNYNDWLRGKYIDDEEKGLYYLDEGRTRSDTDEEFHKYLAFVTRYIDSKTLQLNLTNRDARTVKPSHVYIQKAVDNPDSVTRIGIVLDAAFAEGHMHKFLIAFGGNPAQSVIVPNAWSKTGAAWFNADELREATKEDGMGYFYRWKK